MSAVVQATCPGCKQVLRIPSEWLNQPFRCKHCQTIIQARAPQPTVPARPSPSAPTPPPASRSVKAPPAPRVTPPSAAPVARPAPAQAAPMAIPIAAKPGALAPMAIPLPASAAKPAPAAVPLPLPVATAPGAFNGIDEANPGLKPRRRRGSWFPLLFGMVLLGASAGVTFYFWPQLAPLFENQGGKVAKKDDQPAAPAPEEVKKTTGDTSKPVKDRDSAPARDKDGTTPKPDPNKDKPKPDPNKDKPKPDPNKDKPKPDPNKDKPKPDPNKDKPKPDPTKDQKLDPNKDKPKPKPPFDGAFPRRSLVVSVHNYLFANPVSAGDNAPNGRNLQNFTAQLSQQRSWRIAPSQIAFLSDAARPPRHQPNPPVKAAIEGTVAEFLKSSRPVDRVVLMFIGHAVEIDDKAYLAPIEGDLTAAATLIPLEWVYKQLEECPARQKLLVLDICRFSPSRGEERPGSPPMGAKFDLALKNPPPGVQVWTSCTEGQRSYEIEEGNFNNAVFVDALYQVSANGIEGVIQKPDDAYPLERMVERVNEAMKRVLGPRKLEQTSRLTGQPKEGGATFDPSMKAAPEPLIVGAAKKTSADAVLVRSILKELSVPPIKKQQDEGLLRYEAIPPIPAEALDKFPVDNTPSKLREAVERAQAVLWAISNNEPPTELAPAVARIKASGELKANLGTLKETYRAPGSAGNQETQFKNQVFDDTRRVASIIRILEDELKNMEDAGKMKKEAPKRWQANYDFMLARLQAQIAYVYEYSSMLGAMRKEFPPRDPAVNSGWRLASRKKMQGDGTGRKLARDAEKILDKLAQDNPGTPWEILAKREKFTALGLEWKPN